MTRSINDTVRDQLSSHGLGQYQSQVRPIVDTLVQREAAIAGEIITYAASQGLHPDEARRMLSDLGMHVPALEPVSVMTGSSTPQPGTVASAEAANNPVTTDELLARISQQLDGLTAFARENGYQG